MASIGDLVTTMTVDSSGYASGSNNAIASNKALGGSLDQIIGQLERQKKALQNSGRTTQDNILGAAKSGATEGQIDAAGSLNDQVEALRAKRKAQDDLAASTQATARASSDMINALEREKATYGMTAQQVALYTMRQRGASQADMDRVEALQSEIAALNAANAASRASPASRPGAGGGNSAMMVTESVRGLEDAVAGFTNNGLKGMLQATTNNVTQLGALMGGSAGVMLGIGAIAALIGVSLIPKLYEWATSTAKIREEVEKLILANRNAFEEEMKQNVIIRNAAYDTARSKMEFAEKQKSKKGLGNSDEIESMQAANLARRRDLTKTKLDAEAKQRLLLSLDAKVKNAPKPFNAGDANAAGLHSGTLGGAINAVGLGGVNPYGETKEEKEARKKKHDQTEADKKEFQKAKEAQAEADREIAILAEQAAVLSVERAAKAKREAAAKARDEEDADNQEQGKKVLEDAKKQAEREKTERAAGAKAVFDVIASQSQSQADKIEKKRKEDEQRRAIGVAVNEKGLITKEEGARLMATIGKDPALVTGGSSAAVQAGSTAAYSSIVRSMQGKKEDQFAKQQLDKTEDLRVIMEKIEQKDPFIVTTISA